MAGMCSSRLVEPPKAAWTAIAFSIAAEVRISARGDAARFAAQERAGGLHRHVEPDRLARGGQGGVGDRQTQGFADDLAGGGGAEELAPAARAGAGAAAQVGGLLQRDLAVGEAHAQRLDLAGVFAGLGAAG